jgi:hypothetical protein
MPEWLRSAGAFMIAADEMSGFASHGGQLYPPAFPWYVLGTTEKAAGSVADVPTTTDVLVTHSPVDSNFTGECNALGIKCLCYVTYDYGPPSVSVPSSVAGVPGLESPTYMGVQFGPVWWEKQPDGTIRSDNRFTGDGVGIQFGTVPSAGIPVPCPNTKSFVQAMLAWIDVIMSHGASGIYVDGVALRQACYGDMQNTNNPSPHAHLYTPASFLPELNPSDPSDPFADWIAAVSQLDPPLPPSELAAAQQDAARQGAQNYAYAQLLRQVRDRVRQHDKDAVVIGSVGLPTFPARWMHWFEQHLDAAFMEGFITAEQSGARAHDFAVHTGLFNPNPWQPPGTPTAPEAIPWPQLVTRELRHFTAAGRRLLTLSAINRYGHGGNTPPNNPPDGPLDVPAREDAFFTYCASRIAGGTWWGGPVWSALPGNQDTDFSDLHQLALGAALGQVAELGPDGRPLRDEQNQPVTSVGAWEQGVLALNWTNQPSPATFRDLEQILAGAVPPGSRFRLPDRLYDLFGRRFIDLTDPGQASAPLVPGSLPGNPSLPGQARIYTLQQQPRYGPGPPGHRGLAPVPAPGNAGMFGPPAGFSPALPGGDFLFSFASADVFGAQIMTGPGGTTPFPWTG